MVTGPGTIMRVLRQTPIALLLLTAAAAGTDPLLEQYNRAYLLAGQGKPDDALPLLAGILAQDPARYRAYDLAAYCYGMKNSPELVAGFMRELRHRIGRPDPHLVYGKALEQAIRGLRKEPVESVRQCIQDLPDWVGCYSLARQVAGANPAIRNLEEQFLAGHPVSDAGLPTSFVLGIRTWERFESDSMIRRENAWHIVEVAVQSGDLDWEFRALSAAMTTSLVTGDVAGGERFFARLRSRALELDNIERLAEAFLSKATYHREQGDASEAVSLYQRALEVYEKIGFVHAAANTLRQLADCEIRAGDTGAAYDHLQRCMREARSAHSPSIEAFAIDSMASIAATRGDYGEAIDFAERSRRMFVQQRQFATAGGVTGDLGIYLEKVGDWRGAEANYVAALRSADRFRDYAERERLLTRLASLALRQGDLVKAAARLRESLASAIRSGDRRFALQARILLGEVLSRQGNAREALTTLAPAPGESQALHDAALEAAAWNALGEVQFAGGRLDKAGSAFGQALEIATRADLSEALRIAHIGLGDVARRQGRLAESRASYAAAIGSIETVRGRLTSDEFRTGFFGTAADVYDRMVDLLARENNPRESWEYAERGKARVLLDRISPSPSSRSVQPQPLSRIQRTASRCDAVLLEYAVGESRSWVWAIDGRHVSLTPLPGRSVIEPLVKRYRDLIVAQQPDSMRLAQALYQMLLKPVASGLSREKTVVIIPDGVLNYLPFETLRPTPDGFFGASFTVSYAPSASVFAELQDRNTSSPARELLAYGDPEFGGPGRSATVRIDPIRAADEKNGLRVTRLPSARREVEDIASLYPPMTVKTYLGSAATKSSLASEQLSSYRRIHFATHAFIDESRPDRSGIALAVDGRRDSILRVPEIARLRLSADLVVLSACQTGLGKLVRGEGVAGLGHAFLIAGASRVVVSLWQVNDTATAEFMRLFYQDMKTGSAPANALRKAKIAMMNSPVPAYRHPRHWAAFVLVGRY